jgi:ribosomal protein L9
MSVGIFNESKETRDRIKHNIERESIRDSSGNKDSEIEESKEIIDVSKSVPLDSHVNLHEILHADVEVKQITHQLKNQRTVEVDLQEPDPKPRFIQNDASPRYANMVSDN